MKQWILIVVLAFLAAAFAAPSFAHTPQADVTITVTLKAADVTALKTALIAKGTDRGPGMGGQMVGDIVDGTYSITDANIQSWVKKEVASRIAQERRQYDETVLRQAQPDVSVLTDAQKAQLLALLASFKK